MPKPKKNETVVWDDDDVWADYDATAEPELTVGDTDVEAGIGAEAGGIPPAKRESPARIETPALTKVEPGAEAPRPSFVATTSPPEVSKTSKAEIEVPPVVQIRRSGISLVKETLAPPAAEAANPSAQREPPPLPKTWVSTKVSAVVKPPATDQPRQSRNAPPPLPVATSTTTPPAPGPPSVAAAPAKIPPRKPPGGISAIFTHAEASGKESVEVATPATEEAVAPANEPKKVMHPKLGPAFTRSEDTDRRSE